MSCPAIINNLNPIFILQIYEMLAIFFAVQNCMQHIPECILAKNGDYRASLDQRRKIRTYWNKRKLGQCHSTRDIWCHMDEDNSSLGWLHSQLQERLYFLGL